MFYWSLCSICHVVRAYLIQYYLLVTEVLLWKKYGLSTNMRTEMCVLNMWKCRHMEICIVHYFEIKIQS